MALSAAPVYYDPYDYEVDVNAHAVWKRMRDEAPLYYNERFDFFALSRYDDVLASMIDVETFSSAHGIVLEMMTEGEFPAPAMIFMDPPRHTVLRKLVSRAFTPRAIENLETRIRTLCAEMLDPFTGSDVFDYVNDFGALLPPTVILALIGFPEGHAAEWRANVDERFHLADGASPEDLPDADDFYSNSMSLQSTFSFLPDLMQQRREDPQDDLVSALLHAEVTENGESRRLSEEEFFNFVGLLAGAGTETVARLLSWAAVILARNPDQRQLLVDDPSLIPNAVEELLRYEAPSPINARWVTRDVEFYGTKVPAGSKLALLNASANRDERHFADPDRFDVRRQIDRHLSFGYGQHFCIGASLARLEARIALEETLKRFPTWTIDESELRWVHTSTVRGFHNVPIHCA